MKKSVLLTLILCLVIYSFASCSNPSDSGSVSDSRDTLSDVIADDSEHDTQSGYHAEESDTKTNDSDDDSRESAEITTETEAVVYEYWPSADITEIIGTDIPVYVGTFSSITAARSGYGEHLPFVDLTVQGADTDEVDGYIALLDNNGYVEVGNREYVKKTEGAYIVIQITAYANINTVVINVGRIKDTGEFSAWPHAQINSDFGFDVKLPTVRADSFDMEVERYEVMDFEVTSAVIVGYRADVGSADAYAELLISNSFVKSGAGADTVYQRSLNGFIITVGLLELSLSNTESAVIITVAATVDAESPMHSFPNNLQCIYSDKSLYIATKIGNDYMLVEDSTQSIGALFYKYNAQQQSWTEYTADSNLTWTASGNVVSDISEVERKVFGFMTDSNTAIFTDSGETELCCGINAKKYVFEYEEGLTIYKLQHPSSKLILEVGVIELEVATSYVTEYTLNVSEFSIAAP